MSETESIDQVLQLLQNLEKQSDQFFTTVNGMFEKPKTMQAHEQAQEIQLLLSQIEKTMSAHANLKYADVHYLDKMDSAQKIKELLDTVKEETNTERKQLQAIERNTKVVLDEAKRNNTLV